MAKRATNTNAASDAEAKLAACFSKYEPALAALGQAVRAKLRARLPGLLEIVYVYERQGTLVISYSPSEKGYEGLCSLALGAEGVKLHFGRGAELAHADACKLLRGRGKTVRHVELSSLADYDRTEIEALLVAALQLAQLRLDGHAPGGTIWKAEEQKQRAARSPRAAALKTSKRKKSARR